MQVRYNYSTGNEFTLSGVDYIGMFNTYSDGSIYTDRYRSASSQPLDRVSNYAADYHTTEYYKDLTAFDELSLPFTQTDVQVDVNELVNFTTINSKLKMLHQNMMYVYAKMFFGDTDVPYAYVHTAGLSSGTGVYGWYDTPNETSFGYDFFSSHPSLSVFSEMDNMRRMVVIPFENQTGFSIVGITTTHIIGLTSSADFTNLSTPLLYSNVIDNASEELCNNLADLTFDGKYLYVTDSKINGGGQVFKYDITGYFTGDVVFEYQRRLIRPIGGLGSKSDNNKFNGCTIVGSKPGRLMVADAGNGAIKVYDSDLTWMKTVLLPKGDYIIKDIRHRKLNDHVHVLTQNAADNTFVMFEYDVNFNYVQKVTFEDDLYELTDGAFERMVVSESDSNVFYLVTNSTVYKKFFSNPTKTFAVFRRSKFGQSPIFKWNFETIKWQKEGKQWNFAQLSTSKLTDIAIVPSDQGYDNMFVLSNGQIYHFEEQTLYNTVLRNDKISYYSLDKVQLEYTENIQSVTINKELFKLYNNILQIKNNIKGRFNFTYDLYGDLTYSNYIYFSDSEIDQLNVSSDLNTRVNDNELIQAGTFNKLLVNVHKLQQTLIKLTKPNVFNYRAVIDNNNIVIID